MQKIILNFMYFLNKKSSSYELFFYNKILIVYELRIYKPLKFTLRYINWLHSSDFLIKINSLNTNLTNTRRYLRHSITVCVCEQKHNLPQFRFDVQSYLFNILIEAKFISTTVSMFSPRDISIFLHSFRDRFLINNFDFSRRIFDVW